MDIRYWRGVGDRVRCEICPHGCLLGEGERGRCRVRRVTGGRMELLTYGKPCALHVDPVEKKPLYHFLPGTEILSLGMVGCNLSCRHCQNAEISQGNPEAIPFQPMTPDMLVKAASGFKSVAYTYTEPFVSFEYVYDCAKAVRKVGKKNVVVTAGYVLPKPLREIAPLLDAANVDIKSFDNDFYKTICGVGLRPILVAIELMKALGIWVEITRLVIPKYSENLEDIRRMSGWICEKLGPDTPLHFSRFFPAHRLTDVPATPLETLLGAKSVAEEEGLQFVYIGNVREAELSNTYCPKCKALLIRRRGYEVQLEVLLGNACSSCGYQLPGFF